MEYLLDRVKELIDPLFSEGQFDLVEISFRRERGRMTLRLLADRSTGGITLDECASLNQKISEILDTADLIQESFALEVSSPGLDRPLRTEEDFRRKTEKEIRVFVSEPVNNKTEWRGRLVAVDAEGITLLSGSETMVIPFNKINKAKEIFD